MFDKRQTKVRSNFVAQCSAFLENTILTIIQFRFRSGQMVDLIYQELSDGTRWWVGERSGFIDRDLFKDEIEKQRNRVQWNFICQSRCVVAFHERYCATICVKNKRGVHVKERERIIGRTFPGRAAGTETAADQKNETSTKSTKKEKNKSITSWKQQQPREGGGREARERVVIGILGVNKWAGASLHDAVTMDFHGRLWAWHSHASIRV